jgi:hypothetical protein
MCIIAEDMEDELPAIAEDDPRETAISVAAMATMTRLASRPRRVKPPEVKMVRVLSDCRKLRRGS